MTPKNTAELSIKNVRLLYQKRTDTARFRYNTGSKKSCKYLYNSRLVIWHKFQPPTSLNIIVK